MLVISGVSADLDYTSYFGGPATFLRFHQTLLHSILGSALLACMVAAAFFGIDKTRTQTRAVDNLNSMRREFTFGLALFVCAVGAASHTLLDLVSGIGVQLFQPFRPGWQGWYLLTNFEPWILILLAVAILLPELFRLVSEEIGERRSSSRGRGAALIALAILVLYVGARANLHSKAVGLLVSREYQGNPPLAAGAFPLPSTPFSWRGVVSTDTMVDELEVSLLPGAEFDPDRSLIRYKPEPSAVLDAGQRTQAATTLLAYASIPFASVNRTEDGYRFELRDLRFAPNDKSPENIVARVDFNTNLQIRLEELRYASSNAP
jgi:inner membrane protein